MALEVTDASIHKYANWTCKLSENRPGVKLLQSRGGLGAPELAGHIVQRCVGRCPSSQLPQ